MTKKTESYFKSHDQHRLYYESYQTEKPRAVLVFVHGLNEHIGRYTHLVDYFKKNYTIYLYDHRGHGRSDGVRSHVESFNNYDKDLYEFLKFVKKNEKTKNIFLIGHSMGGQVVLNFLNNYPRFPLAGFVTSSANIKVKMRVGCVKKFFAGLLSKHVPTFKLPNQVRSKWICRDKKVVKNYEADPLVGKTISVRLAKEIFDNQGVLMGFAPKIKTPCLMMHAGADKICDKKGTVSFYNQIGSTDKKLKIFDGMYHEIFNETDNEQVFAEMASWIKKRCAKA